MVFDTPPIAVAVETEQRPIAKDKYERRPVASDAHQTGVHSDSFHNESFHNELERDSIR